MTHSALERNAQMLPHLSKGYQLMGPNGGVDSETAQREHETGRGYKVPNGAIYTTVGDLARFASFLIGQGPESVLKTASLQVFQMQSVVPADLELTHGYGVAAHESEGRIWSDRAFQRSGEPNQHRGTISRYPVEVNAKRRSGFCRDSL
jgi:CubicO group peptidase (beta-lactamase class C family)